MELVNERIADYALQFTKEESPLLQEIKETTERELEYSQMLSGRVECRFLQILIRLGGYKRILELGTFTGYSALSMAEALPDDGKVVTCEMNERYERIARSFFDRSSYGDRIKLKMGMAEEILPALKGTFDLAFIDADKVNYPYYYNQIKPLMRSGGSIVVDNAFWSGSVLEPDDEKAEAVHQLNKMISEDPEVDNVVLTVRDGINVAYVK